MTAECRPRQHEREIASLVLAEVEEAAYALRCAGIDARVLGDPAAAMMDLGVDAWTDRMGLAVPHDQADRAHELLLERRQHREAKIQRHTKGIWRVALRVVATLALSLALAFLVGGNWRTCPVLFSVFTIIVLTTVKLDLVQYFSDRRASQPVCSARERCNEHPDAHGTSRKTSVSSSEASIKVPAPDRPPARIGDDEVVLFTVFEDELRDGADQTDEDVAGLAICRQADGGGFFVVSCDASWNSIWDTCHATLDEAKLQAEFEYPGMSLTWRHPA